MKHIYHVYLLVENPSRLSASGTGQIATPADWVRGARVVIPPSVSNAATARLLPRGFDELRPYMRTTTL